MPREILRPSTGGRLGRLPQQPDFLTSESISEDAMIFRHSGTRAAGAASQNQDAGPQIFFFFFSPTVPTAAE